MQDGIVKGGAKKFFSLLKDEVPFAYNRFGDGEILAIQAGGGFSYSERRSGAPVNKRLARKLMEALQHEQKNYWKGVMCPCMYEKLWPWVKEKVNVERYPYIASAWVFHNKYQKDFYRRFGGLIGGRKVIWFSGEDTSVSPLKELGINTTFHIKTFGQYTWSEYDRLRKFVGIIEPNDIVCLNCGPVERVLIHEWFKQCPEATFLGIGSIFDPITRGVVYNHHKSVPEECKSCNFCD